MHITEHEKLARQLQDSYARELEFQRYATYRPGFAARLIGGSIVLFGNLLYGFKPSYAKFRAIEIVARIPYQSWEVFSYCAQTLFFSNEKKAMRFAQLSRFSRIAQDNETMHVVVISQLMRAHGAGRIGRTTLIPMIGAFVYFWACFMLYWMSRQAALEVNFLFENHAYKQYDKFLKEHEQSLRAAPVQSAFLNFYGRSVQNEYEFFELIRNDELIHRNASVAQV